MHLKLQSFVVVIFWVVASINSSVAQGVEYELKFEGRWQSSLPRPGSAHFTRIIGSTHRSGDSFLTFGQGVSLGVENVAETGSVGALPDEINAAVASGNAGSLILGTDGFISPEETNTFRFSATPGYSQLSFITMIAPSPDWFVGVHDLELRSVNGVWIDQIELDLENYDAGTENGTGLSLNNQATNPLGVIELLDSAEPDGALFGSGSISRLTLTRTSDAPEIRLGDCNLDGRLNFLDITAFISILSDSGYLVEADTNEDKVVDFLDISPFILLLSS